MTTAAARQSRPGIGALVRHGIIGGIVAGVVFAMFEMVVAAVLSGAEAFFMPLRMIGAIQLGPSALDPASSLALAGGVGIALHMALSMAYGVATAVALTALPGAAATSGRVIGLATLAGVGLWIVNFYVLAPLLGWPWFPNDTNPAVQLIAHAFFFGAAVGLYLDWSLFRHGRRSATADLGRAR